LAAVENDKRVVDAELVRSLNYWEIGVGGNEEWRK
jgi:hypothetical protein